VLQRFRGELTLLGGRGDDAGYSGGSDYDESRGGGSGGGGGPSGGGGGGGRKPSGGYDDLDDEIPF
jgi:single-strand DNA-binding protein